MTEHDSSPNNNGVWVGVDFGTSNCACAVWDSNGGCAKLMRIGQRQNSGKARRIVPSAVGLLHGDDDDVSDVPRQKGLSDENVVRYDHLTAIVGEGAMKLIEKNTIVTCIKRVLAVHQPPTQQEVEFFDSLPFPCTINGGKVLIKVTKSETHTEHMLIEPIQIAALLLRYIRLSVKDYLRGATGRRKRLKIPCKDSSTEVQNVVVGVPAHFDQSQRILVVKACRMAGFQGHVSTITESTAAAMAYGLFVGNCSRKEKHIFVFDMGGGTTDVTVAKMTRDETTNNSPSFRVVVTEGDGRLGGTDMDQSLLKLVLQKLGIHNDTEPQRQGALSACQQAKEELCGDGTTMDLKKSVDVCLDKGHSASVSMNEFNQAIKPLVDRAQTLVEKALNNKNDMIDEVVLVGGATRVPLVRQMLRRLFPHVELCCSLNAEGAVAQGAAIQAAIRSQLVPKHEVESALMLDTLPHAIGVLVDSHFVSILPKEASLPAMGYATFRLANPKQQGVTVEAVEHVPDYQEEPFQHMGTFNFLLRRLSPTQLDDIDNTRSVDIGMTLETDGKLIVSIFDWNDPEHLAKKCRYQEEKNKHEHRDVDTDRLGYVPVEALHKHRNNTLKNQEENVTMEQILLMIACVVLFALYIAVKLVFSGPPEESVRIL